MRACAAAGIAGLLLGALALGACALGGGKAGSDLQADAGRRAEAGAPGPSLWRAHWIEAPVDPKPDPTAPERRPARLFRREFFVDGKVARALVYATSRGLYSLELNGDAAGERVLAPGWGPAPRPYQRWDVTPLIRQGRNAVGVRVAAVAPEDPRVALLLQLEVRFVDGRLQRLTSGPEWRTRVGALLDSSLHGDALWDARQSPGRWSVPYFPDAAWDYVHVPPRPPDAGGWPIPTPDEGPGVRRLGERAPVARTVPGPGRQRFDFGRPIWGRVRVGATRAEGHALHLRPSLEPEPAPGAATPSWVHVASGKVEPPFEPPFSVQRFRFVEVEGLPDEPAPDAVVAVELGPLPASAGP